jgi:5-formyltetrahydrofolate cyclo-ligase
MAEQGASLTKEEIRRQMKAQPHPSPDVRRRVVENVEQWLRERSPSVVVGFLAMGDEIDMSPLVGALPDIRFGLTRTAPGSMLTVHTFDGPREQHPYGFEQPRSDAPVIQSDEIDVVLVPGLAFSPDGRRLGRGAGYYDRFLATIEAIKIGLTTSDRLRPDIPLEPHDVTMDWIATEDGVFEVERPLV